ncbi:hypothetical protein Syn7502_03160 [Synechococcus sp. PCC 7502]|uniref:DUF2252 domain-containing protein n=1 Tax=Synechococcus sp. PCC 7502 TaxID=1173263 RepID=UPI00029FA974|nr:DUF2252 domain-containing protein [Synechococcus sp. PCC 7502]AFY75048.1 hypothetical protein Syn7502_03160 [Synechococcus sp. PCC 7502]
MNGFTPQLLSRAEGIAKGKALREQVPRASHEEWKPSPDRAEPTAMLETSNQGRLPELIPLRYGRMLASPFAFLRGAACIMAFDLSKTPKTGIKVQAGGDCHLSNFGGYGTPERNLVFDVNDFDESLLAPWEWDVKRLATSIVVAGRSLKFSDKIGRTAAIAAVQSYREHMNEYTQMTPMEVWYDQIGVESLLAYTDRAKQLKKLKSEVEKARALTPVMELHKLTEIVDGQRRFISNPPLVSQPIPEDPLVAEMLSVFYKYRQTLREDIRILLDRYRIVDVAMKVVGVGSVGTRCGIALLVTGDNYPLFLQIKEARSSVLEPYAGKSSYDNHGQRVVAGQRLMQASTDIFLGWARGDLGHDFYLRQLRDMKISVEIESMNDTDLRGYSQLCGWALARSHARSGDRFVISGYLGQSDTFDLAIANFAVAYADQNDRDYQQLVAAVAAGKIKTIKG